MLAAQEGHQDVVAYLAERGGERLVGARDKDGVPAVAHAAHSGRVEAAEYLVGKGGAKGGDAEAALLFAAQGGQLGVVKMLLGRGVGGGVRRVREGELGRRAMYLASQEGEIGHQEVVAYLDDLGVVPSRGGEGGWGGAGADPVPLA